MKDQQRKAVEQDESFQGFTIIQRAKDVEGRVDVRDEYWRRRESRET